MQIVRTIVWVLILVGIIAFTFGNFDRQTDVRIWPGLVWDTRVPAIVIVSFVLGLIPMWLYHRGVKWSLNRRIRSLESAVKSNALAQRHQPTASSAVTSEPATASTGDESAAAGEASPDDTLTPSTSSDAAPKG